MNYEKPPCALWKSWIGPEVEGATALGQFTLFVREGDVSLLLKKAEAQLTLLGLETAHIRRIWFCKEYLASHTQEEMLVLMYLMQKRNITTSLCFEIPADLISTYAYLHPYGVFYVKLATTELRPGDHVCVGAPFNDEAFRLGDGAPVVPQAYLNDIELQ